MQGLTPEEKLDRLEEKWQDTLLKVRYALEKGEVSRSEVIKKNSQKKNSHLHVLIESNLIESLKNEAKEKKLSLGELCRQKLRSDSQLDRIERKIDKIHNPVK